MDVLSLHRNNISIIKIFLARRRLREQKLFTKFFSNEKVLSENKRKYEIRVKLYAFKLSKTTVNEKKM